MARVKGLRSFQWQPCRQPNAESKSPNIVKMIAGGASKRICAAAARHTTAARTLPQSAGQSSSLLRRPTPSSPWISTSSSSAAFHSSSLTSAPASSGDSKVTTPWADPAMRQYKYWNREDDAVNANKYKDLLEFSPESIVKEAKILSLSALDDPANSALHSTHGLPIGTTLLGVGSELSDFEHVRSKNPNVLFVSPSCPRASVTVPLVLAAFPSIEWIHVRSAGIDFVESSEFGALCASQNIVVTNAKGQFSSSLAEYALLACSYFAKNVPRLIRQQQQNKWEKYDIEELRGKTLGVVGYGDIGKACVKLAYVNREVSHYLLIRMESISPFRFRMPLLFFYRLSM
jgi:D-isomer specific 2-hydroxyacid dehydrogenase, NAD binding domain